MPGENGRGRVERRVQEVTARRRANVEDYVRPQLQPDEQIAAVLVRAQNRPIIPLIGLIQLFFLRYYSVVVTSRRVLFVRLGAAGRPRAIEDVFDREQVRVLEWRRTSRVTGSGMPLLVLERAGQRFTLRPNLSHSGGDEVVAELGGAPSA
jgi:hypothetical protein